MHPSANCHCLPCLSAAPCAQAKRVSERAQATSVEAGSGFIACRTKRSSNDVQCLNSWFAPGPRVQAPSTRAVEGHSWVP